MSNSDIDRTRKVSGFERVQDVPMKPGALSLKNNWNYQTILYLFLKRTLAYLLAAALLVIAIIFISCCKKSGQKSWIPMSRQWPWISSFKVLIQHFLRQAFRETEPGRWAR